MAATVFLSESNGSVETVTDNIANMNFGQFDGPNMIASQHPINIGQASTGKWWRVKLQALGGSSQIGTLGLFLASGAYVTGEVIGGTPTGASSNFGAFGLTAGYGHSRPSMGGNPVGMPTTDNGISVLGSSASTDPVTNGVFVNNVYGAGNAPLVGAGVYSLYIYMVLTTTASTPQGPVNQKVFTIQYTEA